MSVVTVWTKQHKDVLNKLNTCKRYTAKKEIVENNDEAKLMMHAYSWLMKAHPDIKRKPCDADYPVWVSFKREGTMLLSPDTVILKLCIDEDIITRLNVMRWTSVNNLLYIPKDEKDKKRHKELLSQYGISDAKACMSNFYPDIKLEIEKSWSRAFDVNAESEKELCYGLIWEIKKEWLKEVIK